MSSDYQKFITVGRIVRDPEVKFLSNERAVANFSVATGESWKDAQGEWQESTCYIDCVAWAKRAEYIGEKCVKGVRVLVEGKFETQTWDDKASGKKRSKNVLKIDVIRLLDRKGDDSQSHEHAPSSNTSAAASAPKPSPQDEPDFDPPF